jgi:hypothetical protein
MGRAGSSRLCRIWPRKNQTPCLMYSFAIVKVPLAACGAPWRVVLTCRTSNGAVVTVWAAIVHLSMLKEIEDT